MKQRKIITPKVKRKPEQNFYAEGLGILSQYIVLGPTREEIEAEKREKQNEETRSET